MCSRTCLVRNPNAVSKDSGATEQIWLLAQGHIPCLTSSDLRTTTITTNIGHRKIITTKTISMGYPAYQCVQLINRDIYCSKNKYKNHDEGKQWVTDLLAHLGVKGNDIKGKPYTSDSQPDNATIWP